MMLASICCEWRRACWHGHEALDRLARILRLAPAWLIAGLLLAAPMAQAHKSSDAYLFFDVLPDRTELRWDIALRDLDLVLGLDADGNRDLNWGEIRNAWPRIDALALASLAIDECRFVVLGHALEQRNDGVYAVLQLSAPCQVGARAVMHYSLLQDIDPTHRGIVRHTVAGGNVSLRMLVPARLPSAPAFAATAAEPTAKPSAESSTSPASALLSVTAATTELATAPATSFIGEGVRHILTGYDHLLFLLCLLLPAVLWRDAGPPPRWRAVTSWRDALLPVAKTVTLFTLAHSVTLALAALGWVKLAPALIEPLIALTILLAAFDNLRPLLLRWRGVVTFGFGLIHGFGFAGVLGELQLPAAQFGWALFQFNLGLELGQLFLVLGVVPLLFALRRRAAYVPLVLGAGSGLAMLLAAVWLVERTSDWRLLPS
jgi:hypothetical protein